METQVFWAPFQKGMIDKAKRLVYGVAQIEDPFPDSQGDIVHKDATERAFARWPGNVREMHQAKAVGKRVAMMPKGDKMLVAVRVSEGAEDTWQKVLDGTLTGFSIGGHATKTKKVYDPKLGKVVNHILEYELTELSLVDAPANAKCVITGITKSKSSGKLVASDVLSDVPLLGAKNVNIKKARAAVRDFAKQLKDGDEVVLVKKSDIAKDATGKLVLSADADVSEIITKGDFDEAGYTSDADETTPETDVVDMGEHAKNLKDCHDDIHKMMGEDCNCDEPGEGAQSQSTEGGPEFDVDGTAKGKRAGNLRKNASAKSVEALIQKAVGTKFDELTTIVKALGEKIEAASSNPQPRKGPEGSVVNKAAAVLGGTPEGAAEGDELKKAQDSLAAMQVRANELVSLQKSKGSLPHEMQVEKDALLDNIGKAKMLITHLQTGNPRR